MYVTLSVTIRLLMFIGGNVQISQSTINRDLW